MPLRLVTIFIACVCFLSSSCKREAPPQLQSPGNAVPAAEPGIVRVNLKAQRNFGIKTDVAAYQFINRQIEVTGVISPDASRVAHISPLTKGRIEKVFVNVGDTVRQGDPLLEYDNIELGELVGEFLSGLAALEKSKTELEVAEKSLARAKNLVEIEAIAPKEYEIRYAQYKSSVADINSTNAHLAQIHEKLHRFGLADVDMDRLENSTPERLHREASKTVIKSPFAGVIIRRDAADGETVEPGKEVLTVVNTATVWVTVDVYEKDLSLVKEGQPVKVRVAAYLDRVFAGKVTRIGDVLDPKTHTVKTICGLSNHDQKLKLGMFANAQIETETSAKILAVPSVSVQTDRKEYFVYVQIDETSFKKKVVSIGKENQGYTEILEGLIPGERIVTNGAFYIKSEGMRETLGEEHG